MKGKDVVIYAWPYHELDEAGKQGLEEERKDRDDDEIYCWDVTGMNDFEVPVGPGAYVIEFDLQSNGVPRSTGVVLSRILEENHMRTREDRKLLFCKIVKRIDGLSLGNIAAWQSAIARAVKSDGADGTLIIEVRSLCAPLFDLIRLGWTLGMVYFNSPALDSFRDSYASDVKGIPG